MCNGNTDQAVVHGKEVENMLDAICETFDVKENIWADDVAISESVDGFIGLWGSDVEEEEDGSNDDIVDEVFKEDVQVEDHVDGLTQEDSGVGGPVDVIQ